MKKISSLLKSQNIISFVIIGAIMLITLSLFHFKEQVNLYIENDMVLQIEAIQNNSTRLIRNELNYMKRLAESAAQIIDHTEIKTDDDILNTLKDYAANANIMRVQFITSDGQMYTSYAGELGQSDENMFRDGIALVGITEPTLLSPVYVKELGEIVFDVASPMTMSGKKGVLISSHNVNQIYALLENEFMGGSAEIGITNNKGEVIIGKDISEFHIKIFERLLNAEFSNSSSKEMQENFANGESGFLAYSVNGVERYCSYAPVAINDWYVIVMVKKISLRRNLIQLEQYGLQLTIELVMIMLVLLLVVITVRYKEQKKLHEVLKQAAKIDGLTGIYNRITVESEITQTLCNCGETDEYGLLLVDIDDFKSINDTYGHIFGDQVIRECVSWMREVFDQEDMIGRIGGDEFVILLKDCSDKDKLRTKMDYFAANFYVESENGEKKQVTVSAGLALYQKDGFSFMELYQYADAALYRAKRDGKGRVSY